MPSLNVQTHDSRSIDLVRDLLTKAVVRSGCDPLQVGDTIIAKRGMQGVSWGLEICFQLSETNKGTDIFVNGSIGGYGPIQKAQLSKCAEQIMSALANDSTMPEVPKIERESVPLQLNDISAQCEQLEQTLKNASNYNVTPQFEPLSTDTFRNSIPSYQMDSTTLLLTKDFIPQEKMMFMNDYNSNKKSVTTGVILALLLGGIGVHKFWLGSAGVGILYLLFCWTFIPAFIAIIDACLMGNSVKKYNGRVANDAYQKIMMLR